MIILKLKSNISHYLLGEHFETKYYILNKKKWLPSKELL